MCYYENTKLSFNIRNYSKYVKEIIFLYKNRCMYTNEVVRKRGKDS